MNVYAKLAFDALKSLRYKHLHIALDGALDGEMVSRVDFNGVNENSVTPVKGYLARQTALTSMPALPDNLPALRFDRERKALYINGLYRHGFLLTPTIVEEVLGLLSIEGQPSGCWPSLWQNYAETSADILTSNESQTCLSL